MGLFSKRPVQPTRPATFGLGRALETNTSLERTLASLAEAFHRFSPTPYQHMRPFGYSRIVWFGEQPSPQVVATAQYLPTKDNITCAFFDRGECTSVYLYSLSGDTQLPIIGAWKQQEHSLRSVGSAPGGVVALTAPVVPQDYLSDLVHLGGFEPTPTNMAIAGVHARQQFLMKSYSYITNMLGEVAAKQFVDGHQDSTLAGLQQILDDLAELVPETIPYIQDIPERMRGLLLGVNVNGRTADIWAELV